MNYYTFIFIDGTSYVVIASELRTARFILMEKKGTDIMNFVSSILIIALPKNTRYKYNQIIK